jgi:hypothetical protein
MSFADFPMYRGAFKRSVAQTAQVQDEQVDIIDFQAVARRSERLSLSYSLDIETRIVCSHKSSSSAQTLIVDKTR